MGWVTLEDGQHVLIGSSGRVLATRAQISSASGGKERGKALAARSKAAIDKATGKNKNGLAAAVTEAAKHDPEQSNVLLGAYQHAIKATGHADPSAAWSMYAAQRNGINPNLRNLKEFREKTARIGKAIEEVSPKVHQSPATTRAVEHAKEMAGIRKGATDAQITTAARDGKIGSPSPRVAHSGTTASSIRSRDMAAKADKMAAGAAKTPGVNMEARTKAAERYASESTKDRTARLVANRTTRAVEHARAAAAGSAATPAKGMPRAAAKDLAARLEKTGHFTRVEVEEFGFGSGNFHVHGYQVNSAAGNRNLTTFTQPVSDEELKKTIGGANAASRKANAASFRRKRAERG